MAKLYDAHIIVFTTNENPSEVLKIFLSPQVAKGKDESWVPTMDDVKRNIETVRPGQAVKTVELYRSKWVQIGIKK